MTVDLFPFMRGYAFFLTALAGFGFVADGFSQIHREVVRVRNPSFPEILAYAPPAPYPFEAMRLGLEGSGVVALEIDKRSGQVKTARIESGTGHKILDDAALGAYRKWRFKPDKLKEVMEQGLQSPHRSPPPSDVWNFRIPFTYVMAGHRAK